MHGTDAPRDYLGFPSAKTIRRLQRVYDEARHPRLAIDAFGKVVVTVAAGTPLREVLEIVAAEDFSQFPVLREGTFVALLTENGITRWLARQVTKELDEISLASVVVSSILPDEENPGNARFVSARATVLEVHSLFREHEILEAVLITGGGAKYESLLGIATRWDIYRLDSDLHS